MTNEEARAYFIDSNERIISVAKDENGYNYETQQIENVFMRRDFEAKELAIQALEQQPCEDCISRQAVIDAINFEDEWLFDAKSHNADTKIAFSAIKSKISELPSVTPQRPKGKWIKIEYDVCTFIYKCSKCGMRVVNPYKYCPNCGSDNGGEEE